MANIKPRKTTKIEFRATESFRNKVKRCAELENTNLTELLERIIGEYLEYKGLNDDEKNCRG